MRDQPTSVSSGDRERCMRVIHIIEDLGVAGAERLVVDLATESRQRGIDASVLTLVPPRSSALLDAARVAGLPVRCLGVHRADPRGWLRLRSACMDADLVHAHLFPAIWLAAFLLPGTLVGTEHSPENRRRRSHVLSGIDRVAYRRYAVIVAISAGVEESLRTHLGRYAPKIVTIQNGVRLERVQPVRSMVDGDPLRLISVGKLDRRKDLGRAIDAVGGLPNVTLTIVGDGPQRQDLEARAARFPGQITLLGARDDVPELLSSAHVFVSTSRYEGFGLAAVEALAAGLPVLAPNLPGLREVLGSAGLLHEPSDTSTLRKQVSQLTDDRELLKELRALAFVQGARFSIAETVERHIDLYREVVVKASR